MDMKQLQEQVGMAVLQKRVEMLTQKLSDRCFTDCIHDPGSSIRSKEKKCLGRCVDSFVESLKVMEGVVSEQMEAVQNSLSSAGDDWGSSNLSLESDEWFRNKWRQSKIAS